MELRSTSYELSMDHQVSILERESRNTRQNTKKSSKIIKSLCGLLFNITFSSIYVSRSRIHFPIRNSFVMSYYNDHEPYVFCDPWKDTRTN